MQAHPVAEIASDPKQPPEISRIEANRQANIRDASNASLNLHVRFWPDGSIWRIDERPEQLNNEEWFKRLCARAGQKFQTRAGGRGFFSLTRTEVDALKVQKPN